MLALALLNAIMIGVYLAGPGDREKPDVEWRAPDAVDSGVPSLKLMSEFADRGMPASGTTECFTVGPFDDSEASDRAMRQLARSAVSITQRRTRAEVDSGTLVYLPAQPDYITARSMSDTLRLAGLGEPEVIAEVDALYSVSLKTFLRPDEAQAFRDEARALGFAVEMRAVRQIESRFWVDYEQCAGAPYLLPESEGLISPEIHHALPCAPG